MDKGHLMEITVLQDTLVPETNPESFEGKFPCWEIIGGQNGQPGPANQAGQLSGILAYGFVPIVGHDS